VTTESILGRLSKVQPNGDRRWMACCPAHDDRSRSLSIGESVSGKTLINCFAGCGAIEVLHALGMDWKDAMPPDDRIVDGRPERPPYNAQAVLESLAREGLIVLLVAKAVCSKRPVSEEDYQRVRKSVTILTDALDKIKGNLREL
jgi:hypothetical protein